MNIDLINVTLDRNIIIEAPRYPSLKAGLQYMIELVEESNIESFNMFRTDEDVIALLGVKDWPNYDREIVQAVFGIKAEILDEQTQDFSESDVLSLFTYDMGETINVDDWLEYAKELLNDLN